METDRGLCGHYPYYYRQAQRVILQTLCEKSLGLLTAVHFGMDGLMHAGDFS
jgi:hypothetical protein